MNKFIKGMDISTLIELERCGAKYYDCGKEGDLFDILKAYGTNSVRIRLWNDPYDGQGMPYGAGTNDLETMVILSAGSMPVRLTGTWCWVSVGKARFIME